MIVAGALTLLGVSGCVRVASHGVTDVEARFFVHTLWADLDRSVRPMDVHAAAREAFALHGLTVFKDQASGVRTELAGQEPGDRWPTRIVVETRDTGATTHVWVTMRPNADEVVMREVLESILRELGV